LSVSASGRRDIARDFGERPFDFIGCRIEAEITFDHDLGVRRDFKIDDERQPDPRAATTHPATLDLLADDRHADDMARAGLVAPDLLFLAADAHRKRFAFHARHRLRTRHLHEIRHMLGVVDFVEQSLLVGIDVHARDEQISGLDRHRIPSLARGFI